MDVFIVLSYRASKLGLSRKMGSMSHGVVKPYSLSLENFENLRECRKLNRHLITETTFIGAERETDFKYFRGNLISNFYGSHVFSFISLAHISLIVNHHIIEKHKIPKPYPPFLTTPSS